MTKSGSAALFFILIALCTAIGAELRMVSYDSAVVSFAKSLKCHNNGYKCRCALATKSTVSLCTSPKDPSNLSLEAKPYVNLSTWRNSEPHQNICLKRLCSPTSYECDCDGDFICEQYREMSSLVCDSYGTSEHCPCSRHPRKKPRFGLRLVSVFTESNARARSLCEWPADFWA